jgi:ribosomal protein S18 acetylase RimI-like enzyme
MQVGELRTGTNGEVARIILGAVIDANLRKTFPLNTTIHDVGEDERSGSVGFIDTTVSQLLVPGVVDDRGCPYDWSSERTLSILRVGVEPNYQRQGFGRALVQLAERRALEQNVEAVLARQIISTPSKIMFENLGYRTYRDDDGQLHAVKHLS